MDTHEKLGNLLSEYLSSQEPETTVPEEVLTAFHAFGLTEFASRKIVDETYQKKLDTLKTDLIASGNSIYSRQYEAQQKKEIDSAYALITGWLNR